MKTFRLVAATIALAAAAAPSFSAYPPEGAGNDYFALVLASFERQDMPVGIVNSSRVTSQSDVGALIRASFERAGIPTAIAPASRR